MVAGLDRVHRHRINLKQCLNFLGADLPLEELDEEMVLEQSTSCRSMATQRSTKALSTEVRSD